MREAYRRTRKDAAAGVDGVTAERYEADLEANLSSLLERFKSGRYRAPAVRRVHLPKPGQEKKTRPIGIPTLEDKILQRAVLMVLEPVYEQDFLECSYGFRPGRSAHQALQVLWRELMSMGGGWIIDLDIESFFDDVDRAHLRSFLRWVVQRKTAKDRFTGAVRAIGQWCRAHRHWPVKAQQAALRRKLQGHYGYYGITGNARGLGRFLHEVRRLWYKWLSRRSWRGRLSWEKFARLYQRHLLPRPRIVHSVYRAATP